MSESDNCRDAFFKWSGSEPVEFALDLSEQDKLTMWCWQSWQAAWQARVAVSDAETLKLLDIVAKAAYTEGWAADELHGYKPSINAEKVITEAKQNLLTHLGAKT